MDTDAQAPGATPGGIEQPAPPGAADPWRIVDVQTLDAATVSAVIGQVEVSPQADQLAYRESEVDALWTLADMAVDEGQAGAREWLELLWEAHDHVGDGEHPQALAALQRLRDALAAAGRS
jgi:hypothetical protein